MNAWTDSSVVLVPFRRYDGHIVQGDVITQFDATAILALEHVGWLESTAADTAGRVLFRPTTLGRQHLR